MLLSKKEDSLTLKNNYTQIKSNSSTFVEEEKNNKPETASCRATKPLKHNNISSFNLKNILKHGEEIIESIEENYSHNKPKNSFDLDQAKKCWDEFLQDLKISNNTPAFNALSSTLIKTDNNTITLEFISGSSSLEFENFRITLVNQFREKLNNYILEVKTILSEEKEQNFILTKKEKFEKLAQKNSILNKLKEEFGFDLFD